MKHSYNFQINVWIQERCVFTRVVHVIPILKCWKEEQDSLPDYIFGIWNTSHLTGEQKSCGAGILTFHVLLSALNDVMSLMCTWYMYLIIFFPSWQFYCRKIHKQIHIIHMHIQQHTSSHTLTLYFDIVFGGYCWTCFCQPHGIQLCTLRCSDLCKMKKPYHTYSCIVLSRVSEYSYTSLLHCQNEYTLLDSINCKH